MSRWLSGVVFALLLTVSAVPETEAASFAAPQSAPNPADAILSLFRPDSSQERREELKALLLGECRNEKPSRERIEALISDLSPLSPTPNAASSERLQKQWIL